MSKQASADPGTSQDEIDLGQLFRLIGNGIRSVFRTFLSVFLYVKRNIFWLGGLVLLGAVTGYLVNLLTGHKQQLDVIVTPNLDSTDYLYDTRGYLYGVVSEIQSEILARDTAFFSRLGMDIEKMRGFGIEVSPLKLQNQEALESESALLEALKDFEGSAAIDEILRSEFRARTMRDQRITFYFTDPVTGEEYARKLVDYINSNPYYKDLVAIQKENASQRIRSNDSLIRQIDQLIVTYMERMAREQTSPEGQVILENQEILDVPALFRLKNDLVMNKELKKLEEEIKQDPLTIVNFGKPHRVNKPFFNKNRVLFPMLFVGAFLLFSFIRLLNRRAIELGQP